MIARRRPDLFVASHETKGHATRNPRIVWNEGVLRTPMREWMPRLDEWSQHRYLMRASRGAAAYRFDAMRRWRP